LTGHGSLPHAYVTRIRACAWLVLALSGCRPTATPAAQPGTPACPAGTTASFDADSDVGWGGIEQTQGCTARDGKRHGPAIESVCSAPDLESTRRVGHYAHGRRVGTWIQYDRRTNAEISRFTLDESGTGIEMIRDQLGHSLGGAVVNGERDGDWTYRDRDGKLVATSTYARGKLIRLAGPVAWDPPMLSPDDACPAVHAAGAVDDGCPP
jgi:hypothetical protein